jgi:spindle assembly abnormal protein 6
MDLIRYCNADLSDRTQSSVFSAKLDGATGSFSVVESNEFKNLVHISLQMRPANDAAIKAYLASRLHQSEAEAHRLSRSLVESTSAGELYQRRIASLESELVEMRFARCYY